MLPSFLADLAHDVEEDALGFVFGDCEAFDQGVLGAVLLHLGRVADPRESAGFAVPGLGLSGELDSERDDIFRN